MKFCERCFKKFAEKWAKKCNYDPKYKLDVKRMVFPCQVPLHEPDMLTGEPKVRIWNCKKEKFDVMSLKEYNSRKDKGEL